MPGYVVNHRYRSSSGTKLEQGSIVDLDVALADWVNRDSPGCLTAVDSAEPEPEPVPGPVAEVDPAVEVEVVEVEPEPARKGGRRGS